LPIAPRRHSAASTLSNSGEHILSTWPLLHLARLEAHAEPILSMYSPAATSALLQSSLSARHSFLESRACPTAKPSAAFSPVLGEVHRSCLRSEFVRGGSEWGVTVLRKRRTVSVPWSWQVDARFSIVVSDPRSHHRRYGLDPTPSRRSPKSSRSTADENVAGGRWL
jgi:hypothetical protein